MIYNIINLALITWVVSIVYTLMKFRNVIIHKKGTHYLTFPTFIPTFGKKFENTIVFNNKSKYTIINQKDASKIFGITIRNSFRHHKNSVRFIWRYYNGSFQVGIRAYIDGKPFNKFFEPSIEEYKSVSLKMYKEKSHVSCFMSYDGEEYLITVNHDTVRFNLFSLFLMPYFGGEDSAPCDVEYEIHNNIYNKNGEFKLENGMILNF